MRRLLSTALAMAAACGSTDKKELVDEAPKAFRLTQLANAVAGAETTFTVAAIDTSGVVDTSYRGTVLFATDDTRSTAPAEATFSQTDAGRITAKVVFKTAGPRTFVVVDKANPSALGLLHLVVASGPAARLTLEGLPVQVAADAVQSVTVTVRDAFDNPVTDYAGSLRFTNTDAQASSLPDTTFVPSDGGVKVVTVQFATSGRQSLSAADIATPSIAGSASTLVLHGPVAGLVLSGIPPSTLSGASLTVTVAAVDGHGNLATDFAGTVHFDATDPRAALPPDYTFTADDQGSHTFAVVLTTAATSTTITVATPNLPAAVASVSVHESAAAQVRLEGLPATVVADAIQSVTVRVVDGLGNTVTDYTGTLRFSNTDGQASPIPDLAFSPADAGTKVVTVQFATAGTQTLSATDTLSPQIGGSVTIQVLHGAAALLKLIGIPPSTVAGVTLTANVTVVDAHGNVATDFVGTVHFASTDPTAARVSDLVLTPLDLGSSNFPVVFTRAGPASLTTTSPPLLPATANTVVHAAAASQVTLDGLPVQVVVDVVQSVTATVRDPFGNTAIDYAGTLHFTNTDAQASVIPDTAFGPADAGVKIVTVQFGTAGPQTLSARDTVSPSIAGSASTLVLHGPAARLLLTRLPPSTVAGTLVTYAVTAVDNHGNVATDFTGTVHFSSTDPHAQLQPDTAFIVADKGVKSFSLILDTAGTQSVSVSQVGGAVAGATANINVVNAPAARIALAAHAPQVPVDTNAVFTITVRDRFGNVALDYTGTVHFVSSDPAATTINDLTFTAAMFATADVSLQFGTAGEQSLVATDTGDPTITGSTIVKVTNGPAGRYALSALPLSAIAGEPLSLAITALDAHGNPVLDYAGSAAVTSTDPSDRLPAPGGFVNGIRNVSLAFVTAGPHHATVSEVGGLIHADTSEVTIVSGDATTLVVASASTTAGAATPATVTAKDVFGNVVGTYRGTVTLTSTDPQAILPAPYTFTATDAGQHTFSMTLETAGTSNVTASDGAISGTAAFTIAPAAGTNCDLAVIGKAGAEVGFRVKVMDAFANLATTYAGTLSFDSSDPQAHLPAPATYGPSDRGSRDFTAVLPTPGDQTIRATDPAAAFSCQATVSIVTAQFFAVTFDGPEAWAGTARSATVQAQNATGAPITDYKGTIVFSSSDAAASLPPSVTLTGTEGGHATVSVTFNTIGLQTFTAKDSADATRTGAAFQLVHGLIYTDPPSGGKVRLVLNGAAPSASVVQLDLVSNTSLFAVGVADPKSVFGLVLPSSVRNGAFAAGMNLPLDTTKVGPDAQVLVLPGPANAVLSLGIAPQAVGAAFANGVLYSGISQKRLDLSLSCRLPCTNDHMRGDVQVRPFPGASSLYYSLRLKLTPGTAPGTVFDGQALLSNVKFRAAVRDRSGSDVFSGTTDFAIGKLEVK